MKRKMSNSLKFILFLGLFVVVSILISSPKASALTLQEGDILISNHTQCDGSKCKGITGHAGIVVKANGGLHVLHIPGKTSGLEQIKIDPVSTFYSDYKQKIKVVRPNSADLGKAAAAKALGTFATYNSSIGVWVGKSKEYLITTNPKDISKTYCSEIVWYSYYLAGKTFLSYRVVQTSYEGAVPTIITPYEFVTSATHNGFKIMDNTF